MSLLYDEIDRRASEILASRPEWPCREGCDHCCRNLAEAPRLGPGEWQQVEEGLRALPSARRAEVEVRLESLTPAPNPPVTCPFLDPEAGTCLIYSFRPAACRAYGYYRARDGGRFCHLIEAKIAREGDDDLVWGHHESLERRLEAEAGAPIPMWEWWQDLRRK
ncbi:MAG: YkgJ family cysteine cluster protein [Acidobacteria bacterium]|nr:YkgJ family cysteine cluster protein [Acidobacteriota bacterium]